MSHCDRHAWLQHPGLLHEKHAKKLRMQKSDLIENSRPMALLIESCKKTPEPDTESWIGKIAILPNRAGRPTNHYA